MVRGETSKRRASAEAETSLPARRRSRMPNARSNRFMPAAASHLLGIWALCAKPALAPGPNQHHRCTRPIHVALMMLCLCASYVRQPTAGKYDMRLVSIPGYAVDRRALHVGSICHICQRSILDDDLAPERLCWSAALHRTAPVLAGLWILRTR